MIVVTIKAEDIGAEVTMNDRYDEDGNVGVRSTQAVVFPNSELKFECDANCTLVVRQLGEDEALPETAETHDASDGALPAAGSEA